MTYDPIYHAAWYLKNKVTHGQNVRANTRRYAQRNRELIRAAKAKPCHDCGKAYDWWIMQFDHRDPKSKLFDVSTAPRRAVSIKRLAAEIAKCDVVCANCHCDRTHRRRVEAPVT